MAWHGGGPAFSPLAKTITWETNIPELVSIFAFGWKMKADDCSIVIVEATDCDLITIATFLRVWMYPEPG